MAISYYIFNGEQVWYRGWAKHGWGRDYDACYDRQEFAYATLAAAKRCAERQTQRQALKGDRTTIRVVTRAELYAELELTDPSPDTIPQAEPVERQTKARGPALPRKRRGKGVPWGAATKRDGLAPVFF